MTAGEKPLVTVVLRTWNALEHLKLAYESAVASLDEPFPVEFIIVDDGSSAPVREYLLSRTCSALVLNGTNRGVSICTSIGHQLASGQYVAVIDSDVLLPRRWLSKLIGELTTHGGVIISARRFNRLLHPETNEPLRHAWQRIKRLHAGRSPADLFALLSGGRSVETFGEALLRGAATTEVVCPPDCVGASCMVYDRSFIDSVGGFSDHDYSLYGAEDVDLCWRVGLAGGRVLRSGTTYVHHFEHGAGADGFDHAAALRISNGRLFRRWRTQLEEFERAQTAHGADVTRLRKDYWLLDLFAKHEEEEAGLR